MSGQRFVKIPLDGGRTFECWIPEDATQDDLMRFVGHLMTQADDFDPSMAWAHWQSVQAVARGKAQKGSESN